VPYVGIIGYGDTYPLTNLMLTVLAALVARGHCLNSFSEPFVDLVVVTVTPCRARHCSPRTGAQNPFMLCTELTGDLSLGVESNGRTVRL
jgi:hypothetical protein